MDANIAEPLLVADVSTYPDITSVWTRTADDWPSVKPDEILHGLWQGVTEPDGVVGCASEDDHYSEVHP